MPRHTLSSFSMFPYFTKANAKTDEQNRLQGLLYALKNGGRVTVGEKDENATEWFAGVLTESISHRIPREFLGTGVFLVPMPSSSATSHPLSRAAWPMLSVAMLLAEANVVAGASPLLRRQTAVKKSHMVPSDGRPSVESHATSLAVNLEHVSKGCSITILDDVVSSGTNAMGAYVALRRAGFTGEVRALTATHTVAAGYDKSDTASARSLIVWLEGKKERAWRPPDEISYVD